MNALDLPEARSRHSVAQWDDTNLEDAEAYYNRPSLRDSCTMASFCFFAIIIMTLSAAVLDAAGLFPR